MIYCNRGLLGRLVILTKRIPSVNKYGQIAFLYLFVETLSVIQNVSGHIFIRDFRYRFCMQNKNEFPNLCYLLERPFRQSQKKEHMDTSGPNYELLIHRPCMPILGLSLDL